MARLWSRTASFDSISLGDYLPILVKWETSDTIARLASLLDRDGDGGCPAGTDGGEDEDEEGSRGEKDETAAEEARSESLVSYVTELLEKGFPLPHILGAGSSVALKVHLPVKAEDTISLSGQVVGKRMSDGAGLVECAISVENQDSTLVAEAVAVVAFPGTPAASQVIEWTLRAWPFRWRNGECPWGVGEGISAPLFLSQVFDLSGFPCFAGVPACAGTTGMVACLALLHHRGSRLCGNDGFFIGGEHTTSEYSPVCGGR